MNLQLKIGMQNKDVWTSKAATFTRSWYAFAHARFTRDTREIREYQQP